MKKIQSHKTFELTVNDYFKKGDVLFTSDLIELEVISIPKPQYAKWYFRILNLITFKLFFNVKYTYTIKIIPYENNRD